jgi:hypothetical protein
MGWSLPSAAELPVGTPVWWWQDARCNTEHLEEQSWDAPHHPHLAAAHGPFRIRRRIARSVAGVTRSVLCPCGPQCEPRRASPPGAQGPGTDARSDRSSPESTYAPGGPEPPRTAAPDRPLRWWSRSWAQPVGDGDQDQGDAQPGAVASSTSDATVRDAKHADVPLRRVRAGEGARRPCSTPSSGALRAAAGRPPARQPRQGHRGSLSPRRRRSREHRQQDRLQVDHLHGNPRPRYVRP